MADKGRVAGCLRETNEAKAKTLPFARKMTVRQAEGIFSASPNYSQRTHREERPMASLILHH